LSVGPVPRANLRPRSATGGLGWEHARPKEGGESRRPWDSVDTVRTLARWIDPRVIVAALALGGLAVAAELHLGGQAAAVIARNPGIETADLLPMLMHPIPLIVLSIGLGLLAYRYGRMISVLGWAAAFAVMMVDLSPMVEEDEYNIAAMAAVTAAPVIFGGYLRSLHQAAQVSRERAAETQRRRDAETRAARLEERSRLAHDLHDIVAHHISAMTLRAGYAHLVVSTTDGPGLATTALAEVSAAGRQVLDELRGLLVVLQDPDAVDYEPMVIEPKAAIDDVVARVGAAGLPVSVSIDPRLDEASLLVRTTIARVAREALTNVLKHAGPGTDTRLVVTVDESSALRLKVINGRPAGQPVATKAFPASGHGLRGLCDRIALLGGTLGAGPTSDNGWCVAVTFPASPVGAGHGKTGGDR